MKTVARRSERVGQTARKESSRPKVAPVLDDGQKPQRLLIWTVWVA